jgi:hypothetical protein
MRATVRRRYERGRLLPDRDFANVPPVTGDLTIAWRSQHDRGRAISFAQVSAIGERGRLGDPMIPDLQGPLLVGLHGNLMSLAGTELVNDMEYAQAWIVTIDVVRIPY